MDDLAGRVALITGASGGIGSAVARRLAAAGARVALGYGRGREAAEKLAEDLGADAAAFGADLSEPDAPARQVEAVRRHFGQLDILVANAGIGQRRAGAR